MDRYQIIRIIHDYMSKKPVLKAWIFGSFALNRRKLRKLLFTHYLAIIIIISITYLPTYLL